METEEKIFIGTEEAQELLSVGRNTILALCQSKRHNFPAAKMGRKYLINLELLKEWAKDTSMQGTQLFPENNY